MKDITMDQNEIALTEGLLKIAKSELREDKSTRNQCLEQMRNWLAKNEDVQNVRDDDNFLLRFLRAKKFSVPMAQQTLLKYLNIRRSFPHLSTQLDINDAKLNDVITSGYIYASPKRDSMGRRVLLINAQCFDAKKYTSAEQAKAHFLAYECLLEDPQNQITGIVHVGDCTGTSAAHVTMWNPTEFGRIFKWGEQSLPMRHKEIHLVNVPSTIKWAIDFIKNRLSPKISSRVNIYTSYKDMNVDPECLPLEMGGKIPQKEMVELWKQELLEKRDTIVRLDEMRLINDRGIQHRSSHNAEKSSQQPTFVSQIESIEGSFRKLEFD
ncbi:cellular retinaldehyde binding protein [Haematobia irritans]|uniref:cellular retinaldehyde binding protein n=1 Tax=Haematobia irritans TaxID=7368 RepID=UPI003F5004EF